MNTITLKICDDIIDTSKLLPFAKMIQNGQLVAFPTETVYGLGANCLNAQAVNEIFNVKNRPSNNPLIAHISDMDMLHSIAKDIPESLDILFKSFWPGALTVVINKRDCVPDIVTANGDTVAVRFPSHPVANALIKLSGVPIVAPSANLSGKPSPTCFEHVYCDLFGKVSGIIDGGDCDIGIESTVIMPINDKTVKILRPGGITQEMIQQKGFEVVIDEHVLTPVTNDAKVSSPGMLYKHYAPCAAMEIVRGEDSKVIEYIKTKIKENGKKTGVLCFDGESNLFDTTTIEYGSPKNPITLSKKLFFSLREFDKTDVEIIYARVIEPDGIGLGIYNRMLRAASFNVTAL